jgi:hypothetical protein
MSIDYWTSVADGTLVPSANSFTATLDWEDNAGNLRSVAGTSIDPSVVDVLSGINMNTNVFRVERLSSSSIFQFNATLVGVAGTSLISYRVMHGPAAPTDIQGW